MPWPDAYKQHVKVDIQIQRAAKALNQRHRAGLCDITRKTRLMNQVTRNRAVDDAEHCTDGVRLARHQKAQRKRHAQHSLTNGQAQQHLVDQQRRALRHPSRAASSTKKAG